MEGTLVLPQATLGSTGRQVGRAGLGGEGVLRTSGREAEARAVIERALGEGVAYFDTARAYEDSEVYYGGIWRGRAAERQQRFLTSKSARRDGRGARRELEETLARLQVDYLDLWQLHDLRLVSDLEELAAPGGALDAFVTARQQGLVRHIGVTGHYDPTILARAIRQFPIDTVLMPVNPMEGVLGGFLTETLTVARQKGCGVIGMKVLGGARSWGGAGGGYLLRQGFSAPELLRYAFAQPVDVLIVGCATPEEVAALAEAARDQPMSAAAQAALEERIRPQAQQLAGYRGVF